MESCLKRHLFKYLQLHIAVDGGMDGEVKFRMNEVGEVCGEMSAERMLHEGIVVLTALYRAETWNMGAAERRRLNIMLLLMVGQMKKWFQIN